MVNIICPPHPLIGIHRVQIPFLKLGVTEATIVASVVTPLVCSSVVAL